MSSRQDPLRSGFRPSYGSAPRRRLDGGPIARCFPGVLLSALVAILLLVPYLGQSSRTVLAASAPPPGPPVRDALDAYGNQGSGEFSTRVATMGELASSSGDQNTEIDPVRAGTVERVLEGERTPIHVVCELAPLLFVELSHENGERRARGFSRDGRRQGLWVEWWDSGLQRSEGTYQNDLRDGAWAHWYESGRLREQGAYVEGERDGHWETWHESGERKRRAEYRTGIRDGLWQEWYSDGQLMQSGVFQSGLREGYWEYFHFGARVDRRTGTYRAGRRIR